MQSIIKSLPKSAGVYQYFDANGKLLYVGKAKNLKNRVKSYWRFTPQLAPNPTLSLRIQKMLHEVDTLSYIVVENEEDALILENSLIKQLKPKYNILLRDDKTYPYLAIDKDSSFPRIEITRKVQKGKNIDYHGPFPSGGRVLLEAIYEVYPLVQKKSCLKGKKACLFHQINKCHAPCEGKITKKEYQVILEEAKQSIIHTNRLIKLLTQKMSLLATQERFEEATKIRDWIKAITALQQNSTIDLASHEDFDIIAIVASEQRGVVLKLFMRGGKIISSDVDYFKNTENFEIAQAYKQVLLQMYQAQMPNSCKTILTAHPFEEQKQLASIISKRLNSPKEILTPQRGTKKKLIELALTNANELIRQQQQLEPTTPIEEKVATLFGLHTHPFRVETFDNSHMQGEACVGAMVVFDNGKWDKKSYRRYMLDAKDEYAQMQELLSRRIEDFGFMPPPDLWILDGGKALLDLAYRLLDEAGVNLEVIAIAKEKLDAKAYRAKGSAKDTIYTMNGPFSLQTTDLRLLWVQKQRDEAHRYAISYHRLKKRSLATKHALLETKGVGKATIKKLLDYFGTFEAINNASFEELSQLTNTKVATAILSNALINSKNQSN
ncbi:MAG TPA: excinuclease ABC subunit UvrC [Epsilonproteobacteria bacterium]|nr:excinuclease ABC subunit UvrC [Campylobacterota bacterium]